MASTHNLSQKTNIKVFAFSSGAIKGLYHFGIWDKLIQNMKIDRDSKYIFTGSSIGSLVATKAYHDVTMKQQGINYVDQQKPYYDQMEKITGINIYDLKESEKYVHIEAIKIFTNNNYTVNPIWLSLQMLGNMLTFNGALFKDTKKNELIRDIICRENLKTDEYDFKINLINELRVSATDMNSGKIISFESHIDNKINVYNNKSLLFQSKLCDENIVNVLTASSSIPLVYNQVKCYLKNVDKKNIDEIIFDDNSNTDSNSTLHELKLYDGGVSTDYSTYSLFNDIRNGKIDKIEQFIICDAENYFDLFNVSNKSDNKSSGIVSTIGSLLNNYDKYIKYNDLLEVIGSDLIHIDTKCTPIRSYIDNNKLNNENMYIVEIIATIDKDETQKDITIQLYTCKKAFSNMNIKEIIYIGLNIDMSIYDIISNQSKVVDLIPKMYKQGNKIAELLIDINLIEKI